MIPALMLFTATLSSPQQEMKQSIPVSSIVKEITIYSDRALVKRTFKVALDRGVHKVVLEGLSADIDDRSIRVSGLSEGKARILDVAVEPVFTDTIPHERVQALTRQLQQLRSERQEASNRLSVIEGQIGFIDSLELSYLRSVSITPGSRVVVDEWDKASKFIERQRTSFYSSSTMTEQQISEIDNRIQTIQEELKRFSSSSGKSQKKVNVTIDATEKTSVSGELAYLIAKASWTPVYEVRISTSDSSAQLKISGAVTQWTQEDWRGVQLTLSTAQPALGSSLPEPFPWFVDSPAPRPQSTIAADPNRSSGYRIDPTGRPGTVRGRVTDKATGEPLIGANVLVEGTVLGASTDVNGSFTIVGVPEGMHTLKSTYVGYVPLQVKNIIVQRSASTSYDFALSSAAVQSQEVVIIADRPLIQRNTTGTVRVTTPNEAPGAHLRSGRSGETTYSVDGSESAIVSELNLGLGQQNRELTSTSFRITQPVDIPSDNTPHNTTITIEKVPVILKYVAVPGETPYVYQEARVINATEYPLIAGTVNVFTDDAYVLSTGAPLTLSKDTLNLSVGVDDAFRATRTEVKRFVETVGTFSKKKRVTYEVKLEVRSSRPAPSVIEVKEPMPTSRTERIEVRVIEPPNAASMMNEQGILTWKPLVTPGERKELMLKYWIEYPTD